MKRKGYKYFNDGLGTASENYSTEVVPLSGCIYQGKVAGTKEIQKQL